MKAYLEHMSGRSRAQATRLVLRKLQAGVIKTLYRGGRRYATKYTVLDHDLLVQTDNAHGRLSGPATKRIFQRQYEVYGDKRFKRLSAISSAHIYNLRSSRAYRQRAQTVAKTHSVCLTIGIRRKPEPQGRPGYIRVDTVHQGDRNGVIAKLLNKLLIEQKHAPTINQFYQEYFNTCLNFHRPCGFAAVTVDEKGRRTKKYKTYQTPYERLKMIVEAEKNQPYLREGVTLKTLDAIAAKQTDNEAAALMQAARDRILKKFVTAQ